MVKISPNVSRTLGEYMFTTEYTPEGLTGDKVELHSILTRETYAPGSRPYFEEPEIGGIRLKIPVMSAAMQCVTGPNMAIKLAQLGGIGVVFCSQTVDDEARMVRAVKRARAGFVTQLEVVNPDTTVGAVRELIEKTGYHTIPVVSGSKDNYGLFHGIIEGKAIEDAPALTLVKDVMFPFRRQSKREYLEELLTDPDDSGLDGRIDVYVPYCETGVSLSDAVSAMGDKRRYMPIVNPDGTLKSVVFKRDAEAHTKFPNAIVDDKKRYIAAAAVNTRDHPDRVPALIEAGVDVLFIDASHGWTAWQEKCIDFIKGTAPHIPLIAGNIVRGDAFDCLIKHGIDGIKVGMGSGSICITSEEKGVGRGLATAVMEVAERRDAYFQETRVYIPIIADGGVCLAKDIAMALCMGADSVMMGSYFAPCDESSAPREEYDKRTWVLYWGEGHSNARRWCENRYGQNEFDEGVIRKLNPAGPTVDKLAKTFARMRATMPTEGAKNIGKLREATVEIISPAARIQAAAQPDEE